MRLRSKLLIASMVGFAVVLATSIYVFRIKGSGQVGGVLSFYGTLVLLYPAIRQTLESRLFTRALQAPRDPEFDDVDVDIAKAQHESHLKFDPSEYFALVMGMLLVCLGFALTVLLSPDVSKSISDSTTPQATTAK